MGTIDEIKKMQTEGKSEQDISAALKQKGVSDKDISEGMSQAQIKEAVAPSEIAPASSVPIPGQTSMQSLEQPTASPTSVVQQETSAQMTTEYSAQTPQDYGDMQPSMLGQEPQQVAPAESYPAQSANAEDYSTGYSQDYPSYQPYQKSISSDVITEISEQVVGEKISVIQDKLENAIGFKSIAEAKLLSLDERLRRIEKILDRLQLSILQRVGEYVNDVKDIKSEIEETQKSFKALLPGMKGSGDGKKVVP